MLQVCVPKCLTKVQLKVVLGEDDKGSVATNHLLSIYVIWLLDKAHV